MNFKSSILILLAILAIGIVVLSFASADYSKLGSGLIDGKCIGVIKLEGEIVSSSSLVSTEASAQEIVEAIESAGKSSEVAGVLLEVDSGGGSAVASKEIYDALASLEKPSVAYLREIAASGGYYAASAADYVVANPNTITGSIGARATVINYEELFSKLGLRQENLKTGELKDIGEGHRNLTQKEREILGTLLNETFENFRSDLEKGRGGKLDKALFEQALDARILSAKQALQAGLVDEIGGRKQALKKAASLSGISLEEIRECELIEEGGLLDLLSLFSASLAKNIAVALKQQNSGVQFR